MNREKVYVVDENDKVIGEKFRDELTDDDCWRIIVVWIENSTGSVLIQQRSLNKSDSPGKWSPAISGTVTKGDSYDQTARKELAEELGIIDYTGLVTKAKIHYKDSVGARFNQNYSYTIDEPIDFFRIQKEEVEAIKWVDKHYLLKDLESDPSKYIREGDWIEICDVN